MTAYTIGAGETMAPPPYGDTLRHLRNPRLVLAVTGLAGLLVLGCCTKASGGGGSGGQVARGQATGQLNRQVRDAQVGKTPTQNPNPFGRPYGQPGLLFPLHALSEETPDQEQPDTLLEPNPTPGPKPEDVSTEEPGCFIPSIGRISPRAPSTDCRPAAVAPGQSRL